MSGHTPGRLYADRDIIQQGKHYTDHVRAMTAEGLHSKSDIAAELAHRDIQRDELLAALKAMLTHMGMDEDEWNKPTFDQARAAIAKVEQP